MDNVFGDILKNKLAKAGGKVSMFTYPASPYFPTLNTMNDMYMSFVHDGKMYAAHIIEPPIRNIVIYNVAGRMIDSVNTNMNRSPYCMMFCLLRGEPYTMPGGLRMDETLGEVYAIHLGTNEAMSVNKISGQLYEVLCKLKDVCVKTADAKYKIDYISYKLLVNIQNAKLCDEDSRIINFPMKAICDRTMKSMQEIEDAHKPKPTKYTGYTGSFSSMTNQIDDQGNISYRHG
jgi:hypothetical protein